MKCMYYWSKLLAKNDCYCSQQGPKDLMKHLWSKSSNFDVLAPGSCLPAWCIKNYPSPRCRGVLLTNTGPSRVHDTARHHNAWLCGPKSNVTQLSLDFCKKLPLGSSPGRLRAINFDCNRFSNVCNTWNKKYKYGANSLSNCRGTRKPCEVRVHWTGLYWWTCCVVCCDVMCDDPTVWRWWCNGRVASS